METVIVCFYKTMIKYLQTQLYWKQYLFGNQAC